MESSRKAGDDDYDGVCCGDLQVFGFSGALGWRTMVPSQVSFVSGGVCRHVVAVESVLAEFREGRAGEGTYKS